MLEGVDEYYEVFPVSDISNAIIEGGKKVIPVLNTGGAVVSLLGSESGLCPALQNGDIKMRFFAQGRNGAVAEISFVGMGEKKYVVKATKILKDVKAVSSNMNIQQIARYYYLYYGISPRILIELNGNNPNRVYSKGEKFILPLFAKECKLQRAGQVRSHAEPNKILEFPAGSYLCIENTYSEYLISLLVGEIYRAGTSINFLDTFNFATCSEYPPPASVIAAFKKIADVENEELESVERLSAQYTFVEKIDGVLKSLLATIDHKYLPGLVVQLLHAIATYQSQYKLVHGDLHTENIFYLEVKPDTMWNGQLLSQAQYYLYKVGDTNLYIPQSPYILKVGDWGLSVKYSSPIVGDRYTIENGYNERNGLGPTLPNFYSENYDMMYSLYMFNRENPNSFITRIMQYLTTDYTRIDEFFTWRHRPILSYLVQPPLLGKSPRTVLKDTELMAPFLTPPPAGTNIIELGRTP